MRTVALLLFLCFSAISPAQNLNFVKTYTYETGIFNDGGATSIAYDNRSQRLFCANTSTNSIDVIELSNIQKPFKRLSIPLSNYITGVNSVDVFNAQVAVVGYGSSKQGDGKILFFDTNGTFLNQLTVGSYPEMVRFTPNGNYILVANEGIPNDLYTVDPIGSISVIDISRGPVATNQSHVSTIDLSILDSVNMDPLIQIYGNNGMQTIGQDLEPEYITFSENSRKAYVVMQENNAMAVIDVWGASLDTIRGLGFKDYSTGNNKLDASDVKANIDIKNWPNLFGMYQPDAIESFDHNGISYIVTANQGEARDYTAYSELTKVKDVILNPLSFTTPFETQADTALGRLAITSRLGDGNKDGLYDSLFCHGTRSFSIWDDQLNLVWDSEDDFESILAVSYGPNFNSDSDDNNSRKSRSDDKGPEPEVIEVGMVDGTMYAFIGMNKMGGIMIYNINDPLNPVFDAYHLNRDFAANANSSAAGDLGPKGMRFIPSNISPNGLAMLAVANEVSGTINLYQMGVGISLDENSGVHNVSPIFPNPSSGIFNTEKKGDFWIYSMNGQLMKEINNSNLIDISELPSQSYLLRDTLGNVQRLIKN